MCDNVSDTVGAICVGRAMNNRDMQKVLHHLRKDPVVRAVYDAKSEEIGPNIFRFKAEIGQNYVPLKPVLSTEVTILLTERASAMPDTPAWCFSCQRCCCLALISMWLQGFEVLPSLQWLQSKMKKVWVAEFNGEKIVEHHMERMGGKEQLLEQMYSAMATQKDETVDLALRSYGAQPEASPVNSESTSEKGCTEWLPCLFRCDCDCGLTVVLTAMSSCWLVLQRAGWAQVTWETL